MVITSGLTEVITVKLPEYFVGARSSFLKWCSFSFYGMPAGVRILTASCHDSHFVKGHDL